MKPAVLVTGATGFVGAELCAELARRGHDVYAFARPGTDRSAVDGGRVRWRDGDLVQAESVERAVADLVARSSTAPWVVHCGAVISYHARDRGLQQRVNVEGTRNVLDACLRHRVGRLLHVSSVVTVAHARADEVLDEGAPFNAAELRCDYVDTKRAAEDLVLAAASELDLVVVNPGAIFGAAPRGPNTVKFLQKLAHGPTPPFVPPGSLSVVGVEDVAIGIALALERGGRGRRYLLTESVWPSLASFGLAAELLGVRAPKRTAPRALWKALELGARMLEPAGALETLTPTSIRMLGAHWRFDSRLARTELGWQPQPFEAVLRATIASLRRSGEL